MADIFSKVPSLCSEWDSSVDDKYEMITKKELLSLHCQALIKVSSQGTLTLILYNIEPNL